MSLNRLADNILSTSLSLIAASLLLYFAGLQISYYLNPLRKLPYPPGPPPRDLLLGNARDLSVEPLWLKLTDWATTYGSIMHLRALDKHMIVLSSVDDAVELMEKRFNSYSDRPPMPMTELMGATFLTPAKTYGPTMQVEKVHDMLYSLLEDPEDFMTHVKTLSVGIIMSVMYGYKVSPKNDPFQKLAEEAMTTIGELASPGASIVNVLSFLRFLPPWFPGADFHRIARVAGISITRFREVPFKYVQDNLAAGTASPSFVASLLETCKSEEEQTLLKEVAATGYAGIGADTTTTAITSFIYTMAKFPDIQNKAQEALDRVVGVDRLVGYNDEASLPYIQAIYREVLQWKPVLPLGIFHATTAEDVYNGYYIPKGTYIIPNVWAMSRDTLKYKDPEEFNPDRFLDENNKLNSNDITFTSGFGRRICPGRHMGAATVWLTMATILSSFDIRAPKDASGKEIPFDVEYSVGMISHPHPFKCTITPRSPKAKQLITDISNNSSI